MGAYHRFEIGNTASTSSTSSVSGSVFTSAENFIGNDLDDATGSDADIDDDGDNNNVDSDEAELRNDDNFTSQIEMEKSYASKTWWLDARSNTDGGGDLASIYVERVHERVTLHCFPKFTKKTVRTIRHMLDEAVSKYFVSFPDRQDPPPGKSFITGTNIF